MKENIVDLTQRTRSPRPMFDERIGRPVSPEIALQYESLVDEAMSHHPGMSRPEAWKIIRKAETTNTMLFFDDPDPESIRTEEEIRRLRMALRMYAWGIGAIERRVPNDEQREASLNRLRARAQEAEGKLKKLLKDTSVDPEQQAREEMRQLRTLQDIGIATKGERQRLEELEQQWPSQLVQTG